MAASPASELTVASHRGPYAVRLVDDALPELARPEERAHYLVDARVAKLYKKELKAVLNAPSVLLLEATERAKSLERFPRYVKHLVARGVRRGDALVVIGGGIIQDIACFLAATMLRGLEWRFYPTTLLAQADSCIGSKSSINSGGAKNILGTYTPPSRVTIGARFLETLTDADRRSGVGEMLKVHVIDGPASFDRIAADYDRLFADRRVMLDYLRRSLDIKRRIIEVDEFDRGPRLVMNYGHSFGHAIEAATKFAVPHGIAVTLGMDMANLAAVRLGRMDASHYRRMRPVIARNFRGFEKLRVPLEPFLAAIGKDKKNTAARLGLILPGADARVSKVEVPKDEAFRALCAEYFARGRREALV